MDPRRSPQWVYDAHLSDQPAYFQRHRWSTAMRSRLPAPVRSESGAVPADNGVRLHNRQRIARVRKQSIQTNEYQSVDGAEGEFLWSSPPQNIDLLPQRPNLCLKRCSRADQIDDHPTNKPAKIPHGTTASPDSRSFASQMRFPTGTGDPHRLSMNSRATSTAGLRLHQSAMAACFVFRREISRTAFWDFCNKIGTFETCQQTPRMSVDRGRPEVTGRLSKWRF
jgi:hypothetical protein